MRSDKAEEEVAELMKKAEQLEVELDKTKEELVNNMILQLGCNDDGNHQLVTSLGSECFVGWWLQHVVVTSKV